MKSAVETFRLAHAVSYITTPGDNGTLRITRVIPHGYRSNRNLILSQADGVLEYFNKPRKMVSIDTLRALSSQRTRDISISSTERSLLRQVVARLDQLAVSMMLPLYSKDQLVGLMAFSAKQSDRHFTKEDEELFGLMSTQAVSAIQKAKLAEDDRSKTEFVSIASHELLTPISAIEGYLSMILDNQLGTIDSDARIYIDKTFMAARRLSSLVKDLLAVSRLESGRLPFTPQLVELKPLLTNALDTVLTMASEKGLTLTTDIPDGLAPLSADPDRLTQVLINLASNAVKYTKEGSVHVTAKQEEDSVLLTISDTGVGMSAAEQKHLFEKFYRIQNDSTMGIPGTGLGLYITRQIMERMGGRIDLHSTPGVGSTFTLTLPLFGSSAQS
jgi:signal transduction histidine kinase